MQTDYFAFVIFLIIGLLIPLIGEAGKIIDTSIVKGVVAAVVGGIINYLILYFKKNAIQIIFKN